MTKDLVMLSALELTQLCDESVDIAQGLGQHITVVGFSMGANMVGWVALKTRTIVVITSALDDSVNERNLDRVVYEWRRHRDVKITRFQFDKDICAFHDMIDPEQPYQKIAVVYPKLVELIENLER